MKKSTSLKTLNTIAQSIKYRFNKGRTTPSNQYSKSVECILTADNQHSFSSASNDYSRHRLSHQPELTIHSDEELDTMTSLRRVESERRGNVSGARLLPATPYNTAEEPRTTDRLSHAQSTDDLNQKYNEHPRSVKLSLYRESHLFDKLGSHQRSMSHRELSHHTDGIIDAFGFAATSGYHSTANLHYNRHQQPLNTDFQYRKPPEVPPSPASYQPAPPTRNDSTRGYSNQHNWRPVVQHTPSAQPRATQPTLPTTRDMNKENYNIHRKGSSLDSSSSQQQRIPSRDNNSSQRNPTTNRDYNSSQQWNPNNREHAQQTSALSNKMAPVTSKASFGPVVRRAESMKRIMKKNRKSEQSGSLMAGPHQQMQQDSGGGPGNEVVTEKGRSVKSIVGMFDKPAIHEALAKAKVSQANNSLKEENEQPTANSDVALQRSNSNNRSERNGTQVVHIAKFIHIETPNKHTNYSDAQTSPMQLSPTENLFNQRSVSVGDGGAIIAKAETFNGGPKPKVAVITSSSTSSYLSNDVFTPTTESVDSPVFDTSDVPYQRIDASTRTYYSDTTCSVESYDLAHNPNIPGPHQQRAYPQHYHLNNQLLRQELTDTESSNHYEDLESLRTGGSTHDLENIYEPISPLRREPMTGNYMNFPSSPSNDHGDMSSSYSAQPALSNQQVELNRRPTTLSMETSTSSPRNFSNGGDSNFNESHEEENYSNQVRQASHRTLRQTSVEGNKFKSPTREEQQLNRYNLNKSNVNAVQPTHRSSVAVRPQVSSQYGSDMNIPGELEFVKMRHKPYRTDSCRVQPRTRHVDRTSSYREPRGSAMDLRSNEQKASIRDNLIDFYKRKSRDSSGMDISLDNGFGNQPLNQHSRQPSQPTPHMYRIQSERTFNTRNVPNPRSNSLDRGPPPQSSSHRQASVDMQTDSPADSSSSYIQTWEASALASRVSNSMSSESRSPTSPQVLNESPRVRKPLVAEVSPFSMPGQKSRKDRPSRHETTSSSSSAGSGVLKPMKANVPHTETHDVAPTLPPRNYHPEDVIANHQSSLSSPDSKPSQCNSDADLSKPYQNVFNGGTRAGGETDFDSGYTAQLRRLSKNQYVRSASDASKPSAQFPAARPTSQPISTNPHISSQSSLQSPHNAALNNAQSPHNAAPSTVQSPLSTTPGHVQSPHNIIPSNAQSPLNTNPINVQKFHNGAHTNIIAHHQHSSSNSPSPDAYLPKSNPRLQAQTNNNDIVTNNRQQVLETDIDGPPSPEVQPPPPPRRLTAHSYDSSKPPPKPPKMASTVYSREINHNEHSKRLTNHVEPTSQMTKPFSERIEQNDSLAAATADSLTETSLLSRSAEELDTAPQRTTIVPARRDRRSESVLVHPVSRGEDMTVTSGDPLAVLIHRKHSLNKPSRQSRRSNSSSSIGKEEKDSPKPSPSSRQRETEFSAVERASSRVVNERLNPQVINSAISENRPARPTPFDRYHMNSNTSSPVPASHSRQGSTNPLDGRSPRTDSPITPNPQYREVRSPTPPPRSPKLSPSASIAARPSTSSMSESRKSTPSPHSHSSDVTKASPCVADDRSFVPISTEILADLADQGIDITEKHKCISDESKARLVKLTALNSGSPTPSSANKAPSIRHIRQKSSDEILCDTQVEHLGKAIKDETLAQVLSKPQKRTNDYLPGLFDDVLTKDIPRKQRQSVDSSPSHSKQNSEGDSLHSNRSSTAPESRDSPFDELNTVEEKKEELVLVLKKKLSVLQEDLNFRLQEIEDNDDCGNKVVELVESKCNDREVKKYKSYIDEVEKITKLLLKLSRRLARAENELRNAPMDATDDDKKSLEQKRNNLQRQHNDAKALKESIDRRRALVVNFLQRSLEEAEFEQYDHYISIKLKLIMENSDIEDQITHCQEQIAAVTAISS